jgi:hypothetical protein
VHVHGSGAPASQIASSLHAAHGSPPSARLPPVAAASPEGRPPEPRPPEPAELPPPSALPPASTVASGSRRVGSSPSEQATIVNPPTPTAPSPSRLPSFIAPRAYLSRLQPAGRPLSTRAPDKGITSYTKALCAEVTQKCPRPRPISSRRRARDVGAQSRFRESGTSDRTLEAGPSPGTSERNASIPRWESIGWAAVSGVASGWFRGRTG